MAMAYTRARNTKRARFGIMAAAVSVSDPRSDRHYPGGSVIIKHKPARARSRLDELPFGMFNDRTAAANDVNGIGPTDTMLRSCAARGWDVIGLHVTKRNGYFLNRLRA